MTPISLPRSLVAAWPSGSWEWPHLQRLVERRLRQSAYAVAGLVLGLGGMWLAQPEVGEAYEAALQAQARLEQQLAAMNSGVRAQAPDPVVTSTDPLGDQVQPLRPDLSASSRPEALWTQWQQALVAHDLQLHSLQPLASSSDAGRGAAWGSHVAAWRIQGRFDDWARVWAACAKTGPLCVIERINVVPTHLPGEVQIDAVMRCWRRPGELNTSDELVRADGVTPAFTRTRPSDRARSELFALGHAAEAGLHPGRGGGTLSPFRAEVAAAVPTSLASLPDDPQQWPLAQIRLAGVWQHGGERQAVLSAGAHAVRVSPGQRVSLEGHRVTAITDRAVHLRLGHGPGVALTWADVHEADVSGSASPAGATPKPSISSHVSVNTPGSQTP